MIDWGLFLTFANDANADTKKRIFYVIFIILIIAFIILSAIGYAIVSITKYKGKRFDREMYDAVRMGVITEEKHYSKYAHKKNALIFYQESIVPILIILGGVLLYVIYMAVTENWSYNPWSMDEGFGSLLFTWDFSKIIQLNVNGTIGLLLNWPELTHAPTFKLENWCGYLSCTAWIVGGLWYLWGVQGLLGRFIRLYQLKKTLYEKSLEGLNVYDAMYDKAKGRDVPLNAAGKQLPPQPAPEQPKQ